MVKSLVMYLLVNGSITAAQATPDTVKNMFPQLSKTSPASIARLIESIQPALGDYFHTLATPDGKPVQDVLAWCQKSLRLKDVLANEPGNLPRTAPIPSDVPGATKYGSTPFNEVDPGEDGGILSGPMPPDFKNTWYGTFNSANLTTEANHFGFATDNPFFVTWAQDVNFSFPAARHKDNDIKILFESRYGRNKLNLGFNPYIRDFMFTRSYLSLARLLALEADSASLARVRLKFLDEPAVKQGFIHGNVH